MKSQTTTIIIFTLFLMGIGFGLYYKQHNASDVTMHADLLPSASAGENILYFTEAGCLSAPAVPALLADGSVRTSDNRISAPDGYDYVILDDMRGEKEVHSRFIGSCEDIAPESIDAFDVFEVGETLEGEQ